MLNFSILASKGFVHVSRFLFGLVLEGFFLGLGFRALGVNGFKV